MLKLATKMAASPEQLLTACQAGFHFVEIWTDIAAIERRHELIELTDRHPLEYGLHFPNRGELQPVHLEHWVELYRGLNACSMVIHQPMFDDHGKSLLEIDPSLRLGVENHRLTPREFERWAERNPGLTLDVEHFWKHTHPDASRKELLKRLEQFLERHRSKLRHVHLPGHFPGFREHRPMYCSRDFVLGTLDALDRFKYDGLVVAETAPKFQNVLEMRMDVLLFERWNELRSRRKQGESGDTPDESPEDPDDRRVTTRPMESPRS